jgi:hypothetical protein
MNISITPEDINKRNSEYWLAQNRLRDRLMRDPGIAAAAIYIVCLQTARNVPLRNRRSFEEVLPEVEKTQEIFFRDLARKAGRAHQADALQQLIREFVKNPKVSLPLLMHLLAGGRGAGVVISIDGPNEGLAGVRQIHWVNDKERERATAVSCLKDRLYRAKKGSPTS